MNSLLQPIPRSRDRAASTLLERIDAFQRAEPGADRAAAKGRLWPLLFSFVADMTRGHASRYGGLDADTLYDIVADKTLHLLDKLEAGSFRPGAWSDAQVRAYLSRAARHSVVDHFRSVRRSRVRPDPPVDVPGRAVSGEEVLRRRQFALALHECVERLRPSARVIWVLRVLLELSSKQIARHPSVRLGPAAIDVALARTRGAVRRCMRRKRLDSSGLVPGTFAVLWERFARDVLPERGPDG